MKWILKDQISEEFKNGFPEIDAILLQLLYNRGIQTQEEIDLFLHSISLGDPYLIPDMKKFVDRIMYAKEHEENVVVHGDYDVDGVCSSAILFLYFKKVLKLSNLKVYIPNRNDEGYGLSKATIDKFIEGGINLLITVDCGIKDAELVDYANEHGIDVVISDHHTPPEKLPDAVAVIHPMFYTHKNLCGAGVAFKMIQALDKELGIYESEQYIDLAGLGTVCDIMELKGENRAIVKKALLKLRENERIGLEELFAVSNIDKTAIDTYHIGYLIGPKLNASGRLESAYESLKLLVTSEAEKAKMHAQNLFEVNKKRQEETQTAVAAALTLVNENDFCNVVYIPQISVGIVGLIAGKLTELTGKPSIVLTDDNGGDIYAGSCRSIDAFPIVDALEKYKQYFISFGGHKKAAGLKLKAENYEPFRKDFLVYAKEMLDGQDIQKTIYVDSDLDLRGEELRNIYEIVRQLEPFGEANPKPVFRSRVKVMNMMNMGENGKHLKLFVKPEDAHSMKPIEVLGFNMGDAKVRSGDIIDIVYNVNRNIWNNEERFQLLLVDIIVVDE